MLQHFKGVLIALAIASLLVFLLSLLIPQQMVLVNETIINKNQDSVYHFVREKKNIQFWMTDLLDLKLEEKSANELIFKGRDEHLYRLEFYDSDRAKGLEIRYFKENEKKGVFVINTKAQGTQTILKQQQFWNVGVNPFKKLLAFKSKKKSQDLMEKDMIRLKKIIETKYNN